MNCKEERIFEPLKLNEDIIQSLGDGEETEGGDLPNTDLKSDDKS